MYSRNLCLGVHPSFTGKYYHQTWRAVSENGASSKNCRLSKIRLDPRVVRIRILGWSVHKTSSVSRNTFFFVKYSHTAFVLIRLSAQVN